MSEKYISSNTLSISDIRHDVQGLVAPLSYASELTSSKNTDRAVYLQKELIKKIELIVARLQTMPDQITLTAEDI